MPLYEYECLKCGEHFDHIQKFSDPLLTVHESCGGELRKLLSAPAIQFKGTGWYVTDYARAGKSDGDRKSDSDSKSSSDSKKGDDKKSESKSESKSETKSESKSDSKSSSDSGSSSKSSSGSQD